MDLFSSALNLEQDSYQVGYNEGKADGHMAGTVEGRQFGIQTGFQRFMTVGVLQGRLAVWTTKYQGNDKVMRHVVQLERALAQIRLTNSDSDVEQFEKMLRKARAKARAVAAAHASDDAALDAYDTTIRFRNETEVIEDLA